MKLGDIVYSTKTRKGEPAKVVRCDISNRLVEKKGGLLKETRTDYVAKYDDDSLLKFNGAQVNKTVFIFSDGQMSMEEFYGI